MSKVALIRCESYDYDKVKDAVGRGIDLLGGAAAFVKAGEKIVLKPNWLAAESPEKCVTTHPAVFKAVAEICKGAGATLSFGDSPAFQSPSLAAKKTGCSEVASEVGIEPADFVTGVEVVCRDAVQNKKFTIARGVVDADGMISLPKLKTHGFLKLTGCIKNQFGCIPGLLKAEFHVKLPDSLLFARMLVDLTTYVKPRLYVMDGIMAMEGNGPRGGDVKKMNVLLFSADPVALDATVCRMIDVDPALSPTITIGKEAGLGEFLETEIELVGDPIESFVDPAFNVKRGPITPYKRGRGLVRFLKNSIVPKPFIIESKCVRCGVCVQVCPVQPKAVDWHDGDKKKPPSYKYERCIRCYCCQELCPESAILLKVPFVSRLFGRRK